MPKFEYAGISDGKQVKGEIEAATKEAAAQALRKKRVRATLIKPKAASISLPKIGGGIKLQDISRFTRQFAAMVSAGLPLVQCLDILGAQTENKTLAGCIKQVSADIQGGNNLADSMMKFPKAFNQLYCNMVAAGEQSGNLDGVLNRLAEYQEKADALRRKIQGAMTYPGVVAVVAVVATVAMLGFVIPQFASMFEEMGGQLPLPTRVAMTASDLLLQYWWLLLIITVGSIVALMQYYKTEQGEINIDRIKLKLPVMGDLERKSAVSRFSQTLSTLLTSGVSIIEALHITAKTAGNKVLELGIMRTLEKIQGGLSIAEPLAETGVFPPMVIHMISVGEKTGDLAGMLKKVSEFYQEEVDAAVEALTSVIEPIMICVMGVIIGGLLIAMYLPMFDMVGAIS